MKEGLINLLLLQIIAHLLSDFYLQWEKMVQSKKNKGIKSGYLYIHLLISFLLSWSLSFQMAFFVYALLISLIHFAVDLMKSYWENKLNSKIQGYLFFIDQILHILTVFLVVCLYTSNHIIDLPMLINREKLLILIVGFLLILKPANYFIINSFKVFEIQIPNVKDLKNAGKLIGNTERILILIFIIFKHFEAIGFLLAAKSILRYEKVNEVVGEGKNNDENKVNENNVLTNKTEYVLAGTLLSFLIAILMGVLFLEQENFKEIINEIWKIIYKK